MVPFGTNDVVRLKSGGPNMLVQRCSGDQVICFWFQDDQTFKSDIFPAAALDAVEVKG